MAVETVWRWCGESNRRLAALHEKRQLGWSAWAVDRLQLATRADAEDATVTGQPCRRHQCRAARPALLLNTARGPRTVPTYSTYFPQAIPVPCSVFISCYRPYVNELLYKKAVSILFGTNLIVFERQFHFTGITIIRSFTSIKGNCSPSQHVILPEIAVL